MNASEQAYVDSLLLAIDVRERIITNLLAAVPSES